VGKPAYRRQARDDKNKQERSAAESGPGKCSVTVYRALLSLNCGVEEGFFTPRTPQSDGIGVCRVVGIAESQSGFLQSIAGREELAARQKGGARPLHKAREERTASEGGHYKKPRADPRSGSSRNGENQNRYVVVPMATAERGRGVKNSFLQFFSGGRAVLLEKAEQPRLSELLALGTGRLRHPVGE
jgi:hypothetical protein